MWKYVLDDMGTSDRPPVLVIHGCIQDRDYGSTAGWDELADDWKFYIISPEINSTKDEPYNQISTSVEFNPKERTIHKNIFSIHPSSTSVLELFALH
ncbi:MAG: hypothetical protein K6L80_15460 [Agarilytica sp.]